MASTYCCCCCCCCCCWIRPTLQPRPHTACLWSWVVVCAGSRVLCDPFGGPKGKSADSTWFSGAKTRIRCVFGPSSWGCVCKLARSLACLFLSLFCLWFGGPRGVNGFLRLRFSWSSSLFVRLPFICFILALFVWLVVCVSVCGLGHYTGLPS